MKIPNFGECHCVNVEFGSYDNQVVMEHPSGKLVCIDTCIATEIGWLWHQGINTLNSCCGHKKLSPTVIVHPDDYDKMDDLGYKFYIAPSGYREYFLKTKGGKERKKMRKITSDELWGNFSFTFHDDRTGEIGFIKIKDFFENNSRKIKNELS